MTQVTRTVKKTGLWVFFIKTTQLVSDVYETQPDSPTQDVLLSLSVNP